MTENRNLSNNSFHGDYTSSSISGSGRSSSITNITSSSAGSSSTTTAGITTDSGVSIIEAQLEDLAPLYEDVMGQPMNIPVCKKLAYYLDVMSPSVIRAAIEDTAMARYPSPRYLFAILERCTFDEIYTIEDWKREKLKHEGAQWRNMRRKYPY